MKTKTGRSITKSALVEQVISQFFERDLPTSEESCIHIKTG